MTYLIIYLVTVIAYLGLLAIDTKIKTKKEKIQYALTGFIPFINLIGIVNSLAYEIAYN